MITDSKPLEMINYLWMIFSSAIVVAIYYLLPVVAPLLPFAGLLGIGISTGGIGIAAYFAFAVILYPVCDDSILNKAKNRFLFLDNPNIFFKFLNLLIYPFVIIMAAGVSLNNLKYENWQRNPYGVFLKFIISVVFLPFRFLALAFMSLMAFLYFFPNINFKLNNQSKNSIKGLNGDNKSLNSIGQESGDKFLNDGNDKLMSSASDPVNNQSIGSIEVLNGDKRDEPFRDLWTQILGKNETLNSSAQKNNQFLLGVKYNPLNSVEIVNRKSNGLFQDSIKRVTSYFMGGNKKEVGEEVEVFLENGKSSKFPKGHPDVLRR